jgi:Lrp/AsnC family leucine-responsive transcriptional regulator
MDDSVRGANGSIPSGVIDSADQAIIDRVRSDGRATVAQVAASVGLSPAAVSRRLARLESSGVIKGYVAVIDESRTGGLEAFIDVRMRGADDADQLAELARGIPQIFEFYNVAGDPDLLMHLRVGDREELAAVVNALRRTGKVAGTKTLIVLESWSRA